MALPEDGRSARRRSPLHILRRRWDAFSVETNFPFAFLLLLVCFAITVAWRLIGPNFLPDLWAEMGGMTLDVFFILIVFAWFEHRRARRQHIERQREIIDDIRGGTIRRRWFESPARSSASTACRSSPSIFAESK